MTKVSSGIQKRKASEKKTRYQETDVMLVNIARKMHASEVKFLKRIHKLYDQLISVFILDDVFQLYQAIFSSFPNLFHSFSSSCLSVQFDDFSFVYPLI